MSGYSPASMLAFRSIEGDLARRESELMAHVLEHFASGEFTRKELNDSIGWEINQTTGRVNSLVKKGLLTEDKSRTVKCKVTHGDAHPLKNTTPPSPSNESADVFSGLAGSYSYAGYHWWEMSLDMARQIMKDKTNGLREYAEKRIRMG